MEGKGSKRNSKEKYVNEPKKKKQRQDASYSHGQFRSSLGHKSGGSMQSGDEEEDEEKTFGKDLKFITICLSPTLYNGHGVVEDLGEVFRI